MSSQDYDSDDFTITREGVYGHEEIEVESADDEVTPEAMEEAPVSVVVFIPTFGLACFCTLS